MSSDGEQDQEPPLPFAVELAKSGRAKCKKCKCTIEKGVVRLAKVVKNPFNNGESYMKAWHHVSCIFDSFKTARATTRKIENPAEDIEGWDDLGEEEQKEIENKLDEYLGAEPPAKGKAKAKGKGTPAKAKKGESAAEKSNSDSPKKSASESKPKSSQEKKKDLEEKKSSSKDHMFSEFIKICNELSATPGYLDKTAIVKKLFTKGSDKGGFKGDIVLWTRFLLPGVAKRIYNLQSKQLIKLFARIFKEDEDEMLEDYEQGDVAATIKTFFEGSHAVKPSKTSDLTLQQVDQFLEKLSTLTKEDDQINHFKSIIKRCTADDLKMIIRLIKHDLRINAGPKHILAAIHDDAYEAYQASRDLPAIIKRFHGASSSLASGSSSSAESSSKKKKVSSLTLMTPVLPMLAEACKSVEMAIEKCPNGMLSEIKYDGERVQVHKNGDEFRYFSRSLKPVQPHKVNFLKDYVPLAFPGGDDLILDAEVLMIDTHDGKPLPFGSLGKHKQNEFQDANICLFIFDVIYYNGESLLDKTMKQRRTLLEEKMKPITHRVVLSEVEEITEAGQLAEMIAKVLKQRLEGLVLKDVDSKYEPGKRHWLKVKKDYLFKGAMADSADLVVLGAWYGTGNKGGMMSVFLMGTYDSDRDIWLTVTKVHTGHDDATLEKLQKSLDMVKIGKNQKSVPKWLNANKVMVPDFVAKDPKKMPVWEITGAEFTNQGVHTADGISIRFPRVTRIRDDKDWSTATNFKELKALFKNSAESIDYSLLLGKRGKSEKTKDSSEPKAKKSRKPEKSEKTEKPEKPEKMEVDEPVKNSQDSEKSNGNGTTESRAKYYKFIGTDYIEFSRSGSPLNWIDGRKPRKHLPSDAKRISKLDENELKSRCLLPHVRALLAEDLSSEQREKVERELKTLGARVLSEGDREQATHVVHGSKSVPSAVIMESTDIPKTAKRVTASWVESTASQKAVADEEDHAVTLC